MFMHFILGMIYKVLNSILSLRGYTIISFGSLEELKKANLEKKLQDYGVLKQRLEFKAFFNTVDINKIRSQFAQDLFVLIILDYKKDGYFAEFGALNGVDGSNTLLLESIGWDGLLAEPSKDFKYIQRNRSCKSFNLAVYSQSDQDVEFIHNGGLSTLLPFKNSDHHNRTGKIYKVRTITLADLLQKANSPSYIDYISIDTEGSEFEILSVFDFKKYRFGIITIEHNHIEDKRNEIYNLLSKHDYVRVLYNLTEVDDWYLDKNLFLKKQVLFSL